MLSIVKIENIMKTLSLKLIRTFCYAVLPALLLVYGYYYFFTHSTVNIPMYVITLERTPARYEHFMKVNDGLSYQKIDAIDGYHIKIVSPNNVKLSGRQINTLADNQEFRNDYDTVFSIYYGANLIPDTSFKRNKLRHNISIGELGAALSHKVVWQKALTELQDAEVFLVCEDDAVLHQNFLHKIDEMLQHAPDDWDVIFLHLQTVHNKLMPVNKWLYKITPDNHTIAEVPCYLVRRKSLHKLLDNTRVISMPIDDTLAYYINNNTINAYKTIEELTEVARNLPSEIQQMGRGY